MTLDRRHCHRHCTRRCCLRLLLLRVVTAATCEAETERAQPEDGEDTSPRDQPGKRFLSDGRRDFLHCLVPSVVFGMSLRGANIPLIRRKQFIGRLRELYLGTEKMGNKRGCNSRPLLNQHQGCGAAGQVDAGCFTNLYRGGCHFTGPVLAPTAEPDVVSRRPQSRPRVAASERYRPIHSRGSDGRTHRFGSLPENLAHREPGTSPGQW